MNIEQIPLKIWTYWHDENVPGMIQNCVANWQHSNPKYKIRLLNKNSLTEWIKIPLPWNFENLNYSRQADWARLNLLMEHGGIWLDASLIATGSLDFIHEKKERYASEGFMFYLDCFTKNPSYPVLESWFIASIPHGKFITGWFNEFNFATVNWGNEGEKYLIHLKETYGHEKYQNLLQNIDGPDYLTIHMAAQKVMQIDGIKAIASEGAEKGPYQILAEQCNWDSRRFAEVMLLSWLGPIPRLIKVRGFERDMLTTLLNESHPIDETSLYHQFMNSIKNV
ncbi:unnamed protein product [Adineta steineri]|uniref:Capsular polysaccharide synthesis protein n=1 Tax=Adineta steineri TaxID=433720 RepID=A0A815JA46_9BILA|nr:unnamed protein product [Adineta steineri]CAF3873027.1 unnamed protein product [Adineta steineri]